MSLDRVVLHRAERPAYGEVAPFHPDAPYPESVFGQIGPSNPAYAAVRACFHESGLDRERFGTSAWNPLAGLVSPGETVVVKPNLVKERHPRDPEGWRYVLTHGSVIRAVCDFIWKALDGRGRVVIADAPQTDSSFTTIVSLLGLDAVAAFYRDRGLDFELLDLRQEEWVNRDGVIVERRRLTGDPAGCIAFDLADASEFVGHGGQGRYYGADYDTGEVNRHHSGGRHQYLIAGTVIRADVLFSLPKLKTHKKAGITVSLKNLVGINGDKNWLPHHTEGNPTNGGDEHPVPSAWHRTERRLVEAARVVSRRVPGVGPWLHRQARRAGTQVFGDTESVTRSGNWWGNDTAWRMCLDLNKLLMYGRPDGTLAPESLAARKRHFVLVDGLVAGEGRGPMNPDPVAAGLLVFGTEPAWVDAACAVVMGFDPALIPIVHRAFTCARYPITSRAWTDVPVVSNVGPWAGRLADLPSDQVQPFRPHFGWVGHIEAGRRGDPERGRA